jgi:hypothetical protein
LTWLLIFSFSLPAFLMFLFGDEHIIPPIEQEPSGGLIVRRSDMRRSSIAASAVFVAALVLRIPSSAAPMQTPAAPINLAERLAAKKLRAVNREVTPSEGNPRGVHVPEKEGNGVVWIEGSSFSQGTIELQIRGRDVMQRSFVGVAFHGKDDNTYEAVYLRPFNFRSEDPARRQHAVQYISLPDYDWPRLRKEFPEEFENPVDQSIVPTDWVSVKVVVKDKAVQVFVGPAKAPALEVRKLGQLDGGMVGLWAGNGSDGDFVDVKITETK